MKRMLLIQPKFDNRKVDRNVKTIYPLGLAYIAAYLPDDWEAVIVDEQLEAIDLQMRADLVGITTTTLTANRAYDLAQHFRSRNIAVVLGGVHASLCVDEALRFADAVCVGDGEPIMGELISDFEKGSLKRIYQAERVSLDGLKQPRRELFDKTYTFMPVNTSRGCPFSCSFCAIQKFYGGTYRKRSVDEVMEELRHLPGSDYVIFFTDGNITGYSTNDIERFKELCRRLAQEKKAGLVRYKAFVGYASVNALADEELLDLAAGADCFALLVGFESIHPDSLRDLGKNLNLRMGPASYHHLVKNAQQRGILVVGEIIVGADSDTPEVLRETEAFLKKVNFDLLRLQILQPLPGTDLFTSLQEQGRLFLRDFPEDWKKTERDFVLGVHFRLKNLDADELKRWVRKTGLEFYSPKRMVFRALRVLVHKKSAATALVALVLNYKSRKSYANVDLH